MIWTPDYENHRRENETQNQAEEKRLDPVEGKDLGVEPKDACQVEGAGDECEEAECLKEECEYFNKGRELGHVQVNAEA